jgi:fibronectin-binding autotransporter adhesin
VRTKVGASSHRRAVSASLIAAAGVLALYGVTASATTFSTFTWSGGGTDALWTDLGNWVGGSMPPNNGTGWVLFPPLTSGLTSNQNAGAPFQLGEITFTGSGYTIQGSTIRLGSSLTDSGGGGLNTIANKLVLTGALPITAANLQLSGTITAGSGITNAALDVGLSNTLLTLTGAGCKLNNLQVGGGNVVLDGGSLALTSQSIFTSTDAVSVGSVGTAAASFSVQDGATLDTSSASDVGIGVTPLGPGQMTVTGAHTTWDLPTQTNVGELGQGSLTVENGASVLGFVASILSLGTSGTGLLTVSGAGAISNNISVINAGSTAQVTGTGSSWVSSSLQIIGSGQLTVQSGGIVAAGALSFSNASGTNITVTDGSLTAASVSNSGTGGSINLTDPVASVAMTINGGSGKMTFSGAISGPGSLLKTGASTQVLAGTNTYGGSTSITGGALVIAASGAIPSGTAVSISNGGALDLANHGTGTKIVPALASLTLGGVSNSWTGLVDLSNNDLIVHNGNLSQITNQIAQGFNQGHWNGTGGITSSAAAATSNTALAVELNNNGTGGTWTNSFDGQPVTATDVLIKYTFFGDTNFDGVVNSSDYIAIDNGFSKSLSGWRNGDFNYDGVVNGDDYTLIDNAFNTQASASAASAEMVAVVPEPVGLVVMGVGGLLLLGRRKRANIHFDSAQCEGQNEAQ